MDRELKHLDGVGNNTRLAVMEGGKMVGLIRRNGNRGFDVLGNYHRRIAFGTSLAAAKLRAMEAAFPSPQEAYELECSKALAIRKAELERAFSGRLYELTRQMIAGSNSARHEIEELIAGIEAAAASREEFERNPEDRFQIMVMGQPMQPLFRWPRPPEAGPVI